ncbi:MAG: ABC transporter substrate-binding protein [Polyangia bacterium]|jgi:sulfonate transport system substrate-binding protein
MTTTAAPRTPRSVSTEPVEVWYSRCGAATASGLAIRQGWLDAEFSAAGTVLRSLRDADDPEIRDAHYHHQVSGLFREGGNIPPIWAQSRGADTAVVGITWLDEYQGILSRADSDIQGIRDLAGKRLALPLNRNLIDFQRGAALHGFVTALRLAGAEATDAQFVDVPIPPLPADDRRTPEVDALLEGKVDAIFIRFARGARLARDHRFHEVININAQPDPLVRVNNGTPRPVTVDRAFLSRHPDVVARYLAVLLRTAAWAEAHPAEVLDLLSNEGGGASKEHVLASHGANVHRSFWPKLTATYVNGLEAQKNFLRDFGFLAGDFDAQAWVVREPLEEAERLFRAQPTLPDPRRAAPRRPAAPAAVGERPATVR